QASAYRLVIVIQQVGFVNLYQTLDAIWPLALGDQQAQTVSQRALAHTVRPDQDDVAVHRLGDDVNHVAQQVFAEVNRPQRPGFGFGDNILRRAAGWFAAVLLPVADDVGDGFGRDAVLPQQAA